MPPRPGWRMVHLHGRGDRISLPRSLTGLLRRVLEFGFDSRRITAVAKSVHAHGKLSSNPELPPPSGERLRDGADLQTLERRINPPGELGDQVLRGLCLVASL